MVVFLPGSRCLIRKRLSHQIRDAHCTRLRKKSLKFGSVGSNGLFHAALEIQVIVGNQ
jgi:hypothetical protein